MRRHTGIVALCHALLLFSAAGEDVGVDTQEREVFVPGMLDEDGSNGERAAPRVIEEHSFAPPYRSFDKDGMVRDAPVRPRRER